MCWGTYCNTYACIPVVQWTLIYNSVDIKSLALRVRDDSMIIHCPRITEGGFFFFFFLLTSLHVRHCDKPSSVKSCVCFTVFFDLRKRYIFWGFIFRLSLFFPFLAITDILTLARDRDRKDHKQTVHSHNDMARSIFFFFFFLLSKLMSARWRRRKTNW